MEKREIQHWKDHWRGILQVWSPIEERGARLFERLHTGITACKQNGEKDHTVEWLKVTGERGWTEIDWAGNTDFAWHEGKDDCSRTKESILSKEDIR